MRQDLISLVDKINKEHGFGAATLMSESKKQTVDVISTGSLSLNIALGVFGFPRGRIIEIYGQESSGKTTLAIHALAEAQKAGLDCAYIDMEHAFDLEYAKKLGVNEETMIFSQPDYGEQALEILDTLCSSGKIGFAVVDSVAALVPKAELEGEMGEAKMGLQARMMSQALRKITGTINKNNVTVIFINQLREKIGVMFGNPWTTTGGNALKFYASIRLDVARSGTNKDGEASISNKTRVKVVKNKVAPPFTQCEFDIVFGQGIDKLAEVIDIAVEFEIIKKSGSWYSYGDIKLGQGKESVKEILSDNNEVLQEIEFKILEHVAA